MNKSVSIFHKTFNIFLSFVFILQSFAPAVVYAQEITPTNEPTPEITAEPTQDPSPTPEVTAEPQPTADQPLAETTPSIVPTETLTPETPTETQTPEAPANNENSETPANENAQSQAPPATETPTVTPTNETDEDAGLSATILENVSAPSIDLLDLSATTNGQSASIVTDKADYAPTDTALITGSGFTPNKTYSLTVSSTDEPATSTTVDVTTDANGTFIYAYQLDSTYRPNYSIVVKDGDEVIATTTFTDGPPDIDLEQCRNGSKTSPNNCEELGGGAGWVNGNSGSSNSHYVEGFSIPYRAIMDNLPTGSPITVTIEYDIKHSSKHAIDYITHYNRLQPHSPFGHGAESIDPTDGVAGISGTTTTFAIPAPSSAGSPTAGQPTNSFNALPAGERVMTLFGGTITNIAYVSQGNLTAAQSSTSIAITFTADSSDAVLAWGGHIAREIDWGTNMSAAGISGSPYHSRLLSWTLGNLGNTDRSLSADAVEPPSSITIVKDAEPNDAQDFAFTTTGNGLSNFTLDDDADGTNSNTTTFNSLLAGTFTITEASTSGWTLQSKTCQSDGTGSTSSPITDGVSINLVAGENVTCTFTNTQQNGHLIVQKTTIPGSDQTVFSITATGSGTIVNGAAGTVTDGTDHDYEVTAGTYSATETVPTGWSKTGDTCQNVSVPAGQTVYCQLTNTKQGKIIVEKQTLPNASSQSFEFTPSYGSNFSLTDGQQNDSGYLAPSTYSVSETVPSGWDLTNTTCTSSIQDTETAGNLELDAGETITCVFTNTKRGTIIVEKQTNPNQAVGNFTFTGTASGTISDGGQIVVNNLVPGQYTSTENDPTPGFDLTGISCDDTTNGGQASSGNTETRTATFNLDAGETVKCTFTNTQRGSISGYKYDDANGNGVNDGDWTPVVGWVIELWQGVTKITETTTGIGGFYSFTNLVQGTYQLIEQVLGGWTNVSPDTIDVNLDAGENETQKNFVNTQYGKIIVEKQTLPNGSQQSFEFDTDYGNNFFLTDGQASDSGELLPGTYSVDELTPTGWDQTSAVCSDESNPSSINLQSGETVTCVFTNTQRGQIIVDKVTNPSGDQQKFTFTPSYDDSFELSDTDTPNNSGYLVPGNYNVSETVPSGWALASTSCVSSLGNPETVENMDLNAGEAITCTFTNNKPAAQIDLDPLRATNQIGDNHEVTATVQVHNGNGSWGPAADGTLVTFALVNSNGATASFVGGIDTCTTTSGSCSVAINSPTAGNVVISASSAPVVLGVTVNVETDGNGENSDDAQKNYVNARISISPENDTNEVNDDHNFIVKVEQSVEDGVWTDVEGAITNAIVSPSTSLDVSDCNSGTDANGECTVTVNSSTAGIFTITARSTINVNGVEFKLQTNGNGENSEPAVKTYVDASIALSPQEATNNINDPHTITVHVTKNDGNGVDDAEGVTVTFTVSSGSATFVGGDDDCVTDGDGECSVQINSTTPGANTIDATTTFSVGGVSLTRQTSGGDAGPDGTDSAEKTYLAGNIIIEKQTLPNGSNQSFAFNPSWNETNFNLTDGQQENSGYLSPGTYSVEEIVPAGWDQTSAICDDQSPIGSISLQNGETVTCTFTNTQRGHLIVNKVTDPSSDTTTEFSITASGSGTISGNATRNITGGASEDYEVTPGTYSVSEDDVTGWEETDNTCDDVEVAAGDSGECTITNTKLGNVTVVKYHDHNANGTKDDGDETLGNTGTGEEVEATRWEIHLVGTGVNAYQWTGAQVAGQVTFSDLLPNSFTLSEQIKTGWFQSNIACGEETGIDKDNSHPVSLAAGQNITCEIGNYQKASIKVIKDVVNPDGEPIDDDSVDFDFEIKEGENLVNDFSLSDGENAVTDVDPGTYDVTEVLNQSNYEFVSCDKPQVTVNSNDEITVTCTNKQKKGTITGEKWNDINGDRKKCSGLDFLDNQIISEDLPLTCEETLSGWTIFIDKDQDKTLDEGEQSTTTDENGEYSFTLNPGTYSVCEVVKPGWEQTYPGNSEESATCHSVTISSNDQRSGQGKDFGNHATDPILHIEKTNNKLGQDLHVGDSIVYTITLTNTEGGETEGLAKNVTVTDLLPKGFVYQHGSWGATLNGNPFPVSEPTYASPGVWSLGDLKIGDVVVMTYTAKINDDVQAGLYNDLAWGVGESVDGVEILALAQPTGYVAANFVGTEVNVVRDPNGTDYKVENKVTQDVLGASTFLPATGANPQWIILASILSLIGLSLMGFGYIIRRRYV